MKRLILLASVLSSISLNSQELKLKFVLTNSNQVSSSLVIGRDFSATVGIDDSFNEENIYGDEMDLVDLRSIQRTEEFHECLNSSIFDNSGDPLYFENNLDLKTDIRNMDITNVENSCFELKIVAQDYPINLTIDASDWHAGSLHFFWIGLFDNNCNKFRQIDLFNGETTNFEIQQENSIDRIIVKMNHEVGISEIKRDYFELVPNPVTYDGIIKLSDNSNGKIEIFNIQGIKVFNTITRNQKDLKISTSWFSNGLYIVKYSDNNGNVDIKKLVIK
jgi:hypothetical protein